MIVKRAFAVVLFVSACWGATPVHAAALSESDRQIYSTAFAAAKRGDWATAQQLAATARDQIPANVIRWLQYTKANSGASFADIAAFTDAHPDWPNPRLLRQRAEDSIATATDAQLAPWFESHPPLSPTAKLRQAQIWTNAGRQADAATLIRQTWIDANYSAVDEKLMLQRYGDVIRGEDNSKRLDRLIWDGQTEQAKRMLVHVGPDTAALGQARLGLATMAPGAEALIAKVPARLQNDPGLQFERMRWRRHKDLNDDAATILEHPPAELGRPEAWANERLIVARRLLDDNQIERAYRIAASNRLDSGAAYSELEFLAGWIALRDLQQPEAAYNHFVRLYNAVKLPISLARGAYWAARAAEAMNQKSLAESWYGNAAPFATTYYGQLAGAHMGGIGPTTFLPEPAPSKAEEANFEQNEVVQATRDIAQIGDLDDLPPFLRRISDQAQSAPEFALAARLSRALGRPDIAVATAKRAGYAGVTLLDEGYPVTDLPPGGNSEGPLVLAMTRQESGFDRAAVSRAGAMGLMQLMPGTATKLAQLLHIPYSRERLTSDMAYNVTLGRAYLDSLVSDFSGSYILAVASYNAGPARVRQWVQSHGDPRTEGVDPIDWVERIPFTETRNYVQRVLENLQIYRLRLGAATPTLTLASDLKR